MNRDWVVHKFGGTSVADAARIKNVAKIISSEPGARKAVVVSAMSKVTDALIELVRLAEKQDQAYLEQIEKLKTRHIEAAQGLLGAHASKPILEILAADFKDIQEILRAVWLARTASERIVELISGYGEIWSAQFLSAYINSRGKKCQWLDARKVLFVEPEAHSVSVQWEVSRKKMVLWLKKNPSDLLIITGFIASTPSGISTTLKRNGSDYSASIFGALLRSSTITIWTDVDGVLSADPRLVPDAVVLKELTYSEATELAYFGAKVVHPNTMAPAIQDKIPIWIRNTFRPSLPGTRIAATAESDIVKGFATIDNMALINLEGTGMMGVPGVACRLFGALKDVGVSVVMISQASSEHSICFAVPRAQAKLAKATVERAFFAEIHQGQIQTVGVTPDCSVLAMVGDGMVDKPGVSGGFFSALGKAGVNIRAIAQGSSERNISTVISQEDSNRALRAVHSAFYLSRQTLSVGIIGPGLIGSTFMKQLEVQMERLKADRRIDLRVRGIMDTKRMILHDQCLDVKDWELALEKSREKSNLKKFTEHINAPHLPHSVIIDATASDEIAQLYPDWLKRGVNIITPNKKANTMNLDFYRELKGLARKNNRYYLYHTTVGAGLPLIHTLQDLVQTGDKIIRVEGVLSGTLSYIFNSLKTGKTFSQVVSEAKELGYTEPDPREDLSGMDVARKLVILAREAGLDLEVKQIQVENLVPKKLRKGSVTDFLKSLRDYDSVMEKKLAQARRRSQVLRYIGWIDDKGKAGVELKAFSNDHAFAQVKGSDNIVAFRTIRYDTQPLIIRGPGAGPEVTAAGVFADLLRLAAYLGAPL